MSELFDGLTGAIPFRGTSVLLVTSRAHGDWGIPKGKCEPGLTAAEQAAVEAYEEAGVRGLIGEHLGSYLRRGRRVLVFSLEVREQLEDWPERGERQRAWFPASEAAALVPEADLRVLIAGLFSQGRESR